MNNKLQQYARTQILEGVKQLPERWQRTFKWLYSVEGITNDLCPDTAENQSLEEIVEEMSYDQLDWAMTQVENSLRILEAEEREGQ